MCKWMGSLRAAAMDLPSSSCVSVVDSASPTYMALTFLCHLPNLILHKRDEWAHDDSN